MTLLVKPVAMFPFTSKAVTWTGGVKNAPEAVLDGGCPVNCSLVAGPGLIANAALVAEARPVEVAVSV